MVAGREEWLTGVETDHVELKGVFPWGKNWMRGKYYSMQSLTTGESYSWSIHIPLIKQSKIIYLNLGLNLGDSNTLFCRPGDRETADVENCTADPCC